MALFDQSKILAWPKETDLPGNEGRVVHILIKTTNLEKIKASAMDTGTRGLDDAKSGNWSQNFSFTKNNKKDQLHLNKENLDASDTLGIISLPIPSQISDSQGHAWELSESPVKNGLSTFNKILGETFGGILQGAADTINYTALDTHGRVYLANPGRFQSYVGAEPRKFSLEWHLSPLNPEDATTITDIIYNLKCFTSPSTAAGGFIMTSPHIFSIIFGNTNINSMINLQSVVCTNMSVDYGTEQMYIDGVPKLIVLKMSFVETRVLLAQYYTNTVNGTSNDADSLMKQTNFI